MHTIIFIIYLRTLFPRLPENPVQHIFALVIISIGFLSTLETMAYLNIKTSFGGIPESLKQSGPNRWTRNPQLLSFGWTLLGIVLLRP